MPQGEIDQRQGGLPAGKSQAAGSSDLLAPGVEQGPQRQHCFLGESFSDTFPLEKGQEEPMATGPTLPDIHDLCWPALHGLAKSSLGGSGQTAPGMGMG